MWISTRFGAALLLSTSWLVGCGGQPEVAPQPPPPDAGAFTPPPPPPGPDAGAPVVPATSTPCDPVQSLAMTTMFQGRAAGEAPGMQPEGPAACSVVAEGQAASSETFLLQPGRCYTVLAQGMPNVTEVDVQLESDLTGGGAVNPALASILRGPPLLIGTQTGVQDAAGVKQACYQWAFPFPLAAKVVVRARSGSGPVAAQAYSKKK
jgi:hypothetical protein